MSLSKKIEERLKGLFESDTGKEIVFLGELLQALDGVAVKTKRSTRGWTPEKRQAAKDRMTKYWADQKAKQ